MRIQHVVELDDTLGDASHYQALTQDSGQRVTQTRPSGGANTHNDESLISSKQSATEYRQEDWSRNRECI